MNSQTRRTNSRYKNPDRFENYSAYLYSIHRGKLECLKGVISLDKEKTLGAVFYEEPSVKISSYQVDEREGILWNRLVWFYEKSDEKARELFMGYERFCIQVLEDKIKSHENLIQALENGK